jgi:hypothetical protein
MKYLYTVVALVLNVGTRDVALYRQTDGMLRGDHDTGWELVDENDDILSGTYLCRARIGICFCLSLLKEYRRNKA